jgi:hypothetical protein
VEYVANWLLLIGKVDYSELFECIFGFCKVGVGLPLSQLPWYDLIPSFPNEVP